MFKKLKDKLAEEVKSSPQRIQQFAQAAQAAVTSASSSISDITNSDLFSIGDNDVQQSRPTQSPASGDQKLSTFQDVSLAQPVSLQTSRDSMDYASAQDLTENQRQRRLSTSSFASDVSFRLPSYESPSMYHLQSDVEVSASEAEERGFSSGNVSLDRVTKEQIYAAYRRTQERYKKYRTQYADLARHYKLLERENAKAKSVLVETQDKALRRISELREQCSLEQSAKAHLEKALRVDIEEKNLEIEALKTKFTLLQNIGVEQGPKETETASNDNHSNVQLISFDNENNQTSDEAASSETVHLNNKIEKLEKLLAKYKESFKISKEKNAQLSTEIQILSGDVETKYKEINELKASAQHLDEAKLKIQELNDKNEELQNKINVLEFNKNKEVSTMELDLQKAQDEMKQLQNKINVFSKREEEYAISLAENKLSIHKELESKEKEIKSLKDHLTECKQEIQSLDIVLNDYKKKSAKLDEECSKLKINTKELDSARTKITELESQLQVLTQKCQTLENYKTKADEEYKCLQLQLKQETAEKLAMIDRNSYLENRNFQLTEENSKRSSQIKNLDKELQVLKNEKYVAATEDNSDKEKNIEEVEIWKSKCSALEFEIQEEREELEKLQLEIETLLANDDLIQIENSQLKAQVDELKSKNDVLEKEKHCNEKYFKNAFRNINIKINYLKQIISSTKEETIALKESNKDYVTKIKEHLGGLIQKYAQLSQQGTEQRQIHETEVEQISEMLKLLTDENVKLNSKLKDYEILNNELNEKLQKVTKDFEHSLNELDVLKDEKQVIAKQLLDSHSQYKKLQNSKDNDVNEQSILKEKNDYLTNKINDLEKCNESLKQEIQNVGELLEKSTAKCEKLKNEKVIINKEITDLSEKICYSEHIVEALQSEKEALANKIEEENAKIATLQDVITGHKKDESFFNQKIDGLEHTIESMKSEKQKNLEELDGSNAKCEILQDIINRSNNEQTNLKENIIKLEHENNLQKLKIQELNKDFDNDINRFKQENDELIQKLQRSDEKIKKLQQQVNNITQENMSLKTQSEEITNSINDLEIELREVKKSHTEIEFEKDHLNSIIEQLEAKDSQVKDTETYNTIENIDSGAILSEVKLLRTHQNPTQHSGIAETQESNTLKEENKRLQSDVAGLQTYLAKISKENDILNDKLRELMACSDGTHDNPMLNKEVRDEKEKLDDLIRENNLLEEENLELKDQLNSQRFAKLESSTNHDSAKDMEYIALKERYTSLLDNNSKLENKMTDLEQMNEAVNDSMTQMQQHNERLRLTNDKLERRLDEALVSLRHLHALQENTELEYLRNILYEYLTGTGAHSVTLAKVLAAVVKFDKTQTDQVLQKERERQGFLRQLGLL